MARWRASETFFRFSPSGRRARLETARGLTTRSFISRRWRSTHATAAVTGRGGSATTIARSTGPVTRDPDANARRDPARGIRNRGTTVPVRVANRTNPPNVRKGESLLQIIYQSGISEFYYPFALGRHPRRHRRPTRANPATARPQTRPRTPRSCWRSCRSNGRSRWRIVSARSN